MKSAPAVLSVIFLIAVGVWPQSYPATLNVPVTYYDFHSDGSNPDFNPGGNPARWLHGMVKDSLGNDGLPVRGDSLLYSYEIGKWFRPWKQGNDFERPVYANGGRTLQQLTTAAYDTSFKNIAFQQNLIFTYVPASQGQYQFQSGMFFPLDNMGFGADENTISYNGLPLDRSTNTHNYSFTMHLKRNFKYTPGLSFMFQGDDDAWIFINGTLVLDLEESIFQ